MVINNLKHNFCFMLLYVNVFTQLDHIEIKSYFQFCVIDPDICTNTKLSVVNTLV